MTSPFNLDQALRSANVIAFIADQSGAEDDKAMARLALVNLELVMMRILREEKEEKR